MSGYVDRDGAVRRSNRFAGGRISMPSGYIGVWAPEHPRSNGRYVREHILVAEHAVGRPLPVSVEIHHVDENRANNAPGNLVVCNDKAYHSLLHRRQRALDAVGDANAHKCEICHTYAEQADMVVTRRKNGEHRAYHKTCNARRSAERYAAR